MGNGVKGIDYGVWDLVQESRMEVPWLGGSSYFNWYMAVVVVLEEGRRVVDFHPGGLVNENWPEHWEEFVELCTMKEGGYERDEL